MKIHLVVNISKIPRTSRERKRFHILVEIDREKKYKIEKILNR